jgi:ectoine hydroxylase-related dioxygenase (phytanoyl-CoA dioxygenase family)
MPDFTHYHLDQLPELLAGDRAGLLAGRTLPALGLSVEGEPRSFTYLLEAGDFRIEDGLARADLTVTLSARDWRGLVADVETVAGVLYGNRLLAHSGELMQFVRWEPVLRALYTGRPLYRPGTFRLADRQGRDLDPLTAFGASDDPDAMREFLDAAGYLLVQAVFDGDTVSDFRRAARDLAAQASEGDQQSWWGKTAAGEAVLCRCLNAGSRPALAGLYDDARIARLAELLPAGMRHPDAGETDGITVVFKNPRVREGLSDLPWHRDCGMGGHAVMCPTYIISIYLYDATPEQGCLQFLPGSHRFAYGFADAAAMDIPGAVTVPARAGDVTIHVGDVMHAAPPPLSDKGDFRQSVLLSFHPDFTNHRGDRHYNDVLLGAEDGQVTHLQDKVDGLG